MIRRLFHPLDRYVFAEFTKIFVATALGFPILVTVIDLTDNLDKWLSRNLPRGDIALSYVYGLPEAMYLVLPAAVLFATIFTIGALTRHSEITAAKASGISFYRIAVPIFLASVMAGGLALVLSELAPVGNRRRDELREESTFATGNERYNFAFASEAGRVYKVQQLQVNTGSAEAMQIERRGLEGVSSYPTWVATAPRARWNEKKGGVLVGGTLAFFAARWLQPLLFRQTARDPIVFGVVAVLLLAVAAVASLVPAVRATRADPNSTLRAD